MSKPTTCRVPEGPEDAEGRRPTLSMHRQILGLAFGDPFQGDHRAGAEPRQPARQQVRGARRTYLGYSATVEEAAEVARAARLALLPKAAD